MSRSLRALNLLGGFAVAVAAFAYVGFWALAAGCVGGETSGLCVHHAEAVPALEWLIFVTAVGAPLAGGIAAYATARPRWLALGVALACLMVGAICRVTQGQTGLLG